MFTAKRSLVINNPNRQVYFIKGMFLFLFEYNFDKIFEIWII